MITLKNISFSHNKKEKNILSNISATFTPGKVHVIVGASGAGKSTLLNLLMGFTSTYAGDIYFNETPLKQKNLNTYRQQEIGLIFQDYNLLENKSALSNLTLAMEISQLYKKEDNKKRLALNQLSLLGINEEMAARKVTLLSGGQRQRVGIARALCKNPQVLIADEPTGNLDEETEKEILDIFLNLAHVQNKCVIIVTHSDLVCGIADETYTLEGGVLVH